MKDSFTINDLFFYSKNPGGQRSMGRNEDNEVECDALPREPEKRIITNILNYSRALTVMKTEKAGTINLLMN
jgi:hypothetical protein